MCLKLYDKVMPEMTMTFLADACSYFKFALVVVLNKCDTDR